MEVNVELLTTDKNKTYRTIKLIGQVALMVVFLSLLTFMLIPADVREQLKNLYLCLLPFSIFVAVLTNFYLTLSKGGIRHLGKLNFSDNGLTISKEDSIEFIELKDLKKMKISLTEYKGEPNISLNMINPSKLGIENFLWLDASKQGEMYRFKLMSSNHHHRLNNRINEWQLKYPTIEK